MKAKVVMSEYRNEMCDHWVNLTHCAWLAGAL